jgi:hypothetical protein
LRNYLQSAIIIHFIIETTLFDVGARCDVISMVLTKKTLAQVAAKFLINLNRSKES